MSPEVQLILGCALLSAVVAYAWHLRLRVLFFRLDMLDIAELVRTAISPRASFDPARLHLLHSLADCADHADELSSFHFLRQLGRSLSTFDISRQAVRSLGAIRLPGQNLPADLRVAADRAEGRIEDFLFGGTIIGRLYGLGLRGWIRERWGELIHPQPGIIERTWVAPQETLPPEGVADQKRARS